MSATASSLGSSVDHQRVWDSGYELLELWSSGTYCDVWQVRHRSTYELFAWKQLRAEWEHSPAARASLENDAAVGQLVASQVLERLVETHTQESPRYLIREWFEGRTLEQLMQEYGQLPVRQTLWIARQCAQGLDDLLHAGLIHGDIRAAHIVVSTRTGLIKLTELGAARRVVNSAGLEASQRSVAGPLADYDTVVAPQQFQGAAKDLYLLGMILFRSLAGRMPFEIETAADMIRGRQGKISEDLRRARPDVTPAVAELLGDLLDINAERHISHPAVLANRLMELELAELLKLELPRRR
ncbi:MAG: protein kinase [Planctomycetota bacterium]